MADFMGMASAARAIEEWLAQALDHLCKVSSSGGTLDSFSSGSMQLVQSTGHLIKVRFKHSHAR